MLEIPLKSSHRRFQRCKPLRLLPILASMAFCSVTQCVGQLIAKPGSKPPACSFDVASIRPGQSDQQTRVRAEANGTVFRAISITPIWLLYNAFHVEDDQQVVGQPKWVEEALYDVLAKIPVDQAPSQCLNDAVSEGQALMELLVQRFSLRYHIERKQLPIDLLEVAKGGSKLHQSNPVSDYVAKYPDGQYWFFPPASIRLQYATPAKLAGILSSIVGRSVRDATGLTGHYDLELKWDHWDPPTNQVVHPSAQPTEEGEQGMPIMAAVQEQLGLKLAPKKVLLPVYVIDHIERPSPN